MRYARRAVVGASIVLAIPAVSPARAATYRFRTTLQVRQDTTWSSSRDDIARGVTSGCFGTASGSGTQRVTFSVPFTLALRDTTIGRRRFLGITLPRRFVQLTPTITRNGLLTFSPAPGATQPCPPETARTDGCGTHRYGLGIFPSYLRLYGTRGRNIEMLDIFSSIEQQPPPFNAEPYSFQNPSCPYPNGDQYLLSWNGDVDFNIDAAWRVIRISGNNDPSVGAQIRVQYLPASRVRNRQVSRTVTRNTFSLRQKFFDGGAYQDANGQPAYNVGGQQVNANTSYTATWTLRRIP